MCMCVPVRLCAHFIKKRINNLTVNDKERKEKIEFHDYIAFSELYSVTPVVIENRI